MTLEKRGDRYYVMDATGNDVAMLQKNAFGTHGHYRGWQVYNIVNGHWLWTGVDKRFCKVTFQDPPLFMNLDEAKKHYGIVA